MTHDENTAMERSYHPTGAELWFLLSLLDDRPAPLFWPMGEPAENWPLVAVRLLDAGLAVRGEAHNFEWTKEEPDALRLPECI